MKKIPESSPDGLQPSTWCQYPDRPAGDNVENDLNAIEDFLALTPNVRVLDFRDPEEDEPLPPGFRLLEPTDEVQWSSHGYAWPKGGWGQEKGWRFIEFESEDET